MKKTLFICTFTLCATFILAQQSQPPAKTASPPAVAAKEPDPVPPDKQKDLEPLIRRMLALQRNRQVAYTSMMESEEGRRWAALNEVTQQSEAEYRKMIAELTKLCKAEGWDFNVIDMKWQKPTPPPAPALPPPAAPR